MQASKFSRPQIRANQTRYAPHDTYGKGVLYAAHLERPTNQLKTTLKRSKDALRGATHSLQTNSGDKGEIGGEASRNKRHNIKNEKLLLLLLLPPPPLKSHRRTR